MLVNSLLRFALAMSRKSALCDVGGGLVARDRSPARAARRDDLQAHAGTRGVRDRGILAVSACRLAFILARWILGLTFRGGTFTTSSHDEADGLSDVFVGPGVPRTRMGAWEGFSAAKFTMTKPHSRRHREAASSYDL